MSGSKIHAIIRDKKYKKTESRYRSERYADYLSNHDETKKIIWIRPDSRNKRHSSLNIRKIKKNILELSVPDPFPYKLSKSPLFDKLFITKLNKILKNHTKYQMILWYTNPIFPSISTFESIWDIVIYDCSDNWNKSWRDTNKMTLKDKCYFKLKNSVVSWTENKILNNADVVFASSEFLKKKMEKNTRVPVFLVENGVEYKKFHLENNAETNKKLTDVPKPRLGFTGGMKLKIDFDLLNKVANNNPKWSIVLIGPKHSSTPDLFDKLVNKQNVYWIGEVEPTEVPYYLKDLDLGLMPYRGIDYNKGVFPLKFYEYLASKLPVVGCGLPSTKEYIKDKVYLHTVNNPNEFSRACEEALSWEEGEGMRKKIAKKADWNEKFRYMLETSLKEID